MGFEADYFETGTYEDFECAVCLGVLEDPKMIEKCEHIFCKTCLENIHNEDSMCPIDREPFDLQSIRKPFPFFTSVYCELRMKCKFSPQCREQIPIESFHSHAQNCFCNRENKLTCDKCKFQLECRSCSSFLFFNFRRRSSSFKRNHLEISRLRWTFQNAK